MTRKPFELVDTEKLIKGIVENYYCIPKWCRMSPLGHFDGMGGCWSISSGIVLDKGKKVCKGCEYHG